MKSHPTGRTSRRGGGSDDSASARGTRGTHAARSAAGSHDSGKRGRLRDEATLGVTILIVGALYAVLLATRVGPLDGVWSIDQGVRLEHIESLLATGFRSLATVYPGDRIDPNHEFTPLLGQYLYRKGRSYSMFSAAFSALSSGPYRLFSYPGLFVLPIVSTLALLFLAGLLTREVLTTRWRQILILALGLTTPLLFYSLVFWDHTLVSMLALLAIYWSIQPAERVPSRLALGGAALGVAVWFRPEMGLAVPALAGSLLLSSRPPPWKATGALVAGAGAALLPLFLFNQLAYGTFLGPHVLVAGRVTYVGQGLSTLAQKRVDWASVLIAPFRRSVLIAIAALVLIRILYARLPGGRNRQRLLALSAVVLGFLGVALLRRPDQGLQTSLVVTAPFALLWLLPWPGQRSSQAGGRHVAQKAAKEAGRVFASSAKIGQRLGLFAALFVMFAFLAGLPDGGNQWGPRMLLPAVAPFVIAGFLRLAEWSGRPIPAPAGAALVAAVLVLGAAGLFSEFRGIRAIRTANEEARRICDAVVERGERVVVCSDTAVPKLLASIFYRDYLIFRAETAGRFERLAARLANHGLRRLVLIDRRSDPVLGSVPERLKVVAEGPPVDLPDGYEISVLRLP